ncbi:MAG: alpha-galactosidase [Pseudomonadota bacterium]
MSIVRYYPQALIRSKKEGKTIAQNGSAQLVVLTGQRAQMILELDAQSGPTWRHFGPPISEPISLLPLRETLNEATYSLERPALASLFPLFGNGWHGQAALKVHRSGQDWCLAPKAWTLCSASQDEAHFRLQDDVAAITVDVRIRLCRHSDVFTLQSQITNSGSSSLSVMSLMSGACPLPPEANRVTSLTGHHTSEFSEDTTTLSRARWVRENDRGVTSHACPPVATVSSPQTLRQSGPVWSAQLAWSGNSLQVIDPSTQGERLWLCGAAYAPGEINLDAAEQLSSPEWLITFSPGGFDGAAQNFHTKLRDRAPSSHGSRGPRLVHLNTWEALYFDHDESDLKNLASVAAALGVERFVLDDGWFEGRNNDHTSLGDWIADPLKYPSGLGPLAEHVTGLGMSFGLWVEPEMVSPDSDLYRQHPEWALQIKGQKPATARHQLVIDLTRDEAFAYVLETLDQLLTDLPLDYLKWDHNRALTQAGNSQGRAAYTAQTEAYYRLLAKLRGAYPNIEIESCAAGGGRIDSGILRFADRVWVSDNLDALSRLSMQKAFLQYFPPEVMGSHVGAAPAHATGRQQSMAFRIAAAMTGHFGLELDPRRLNEVDRQSLSEGIGLYKAHRQTLHSGRVWRGDGGDGLVWQAHQTDEATLVFVYRTQPPLEAVSRRLRLPFMNAVKSVTITPILGQDLRPLNHASLNGDHIAELGLNLPKLKAEEALAFALVT